MAPVVANMAQVPDADRAAIAEYVMSLPSRAGRKPPQ
jgi:mono/diheme cytochrome c family protein